MNTMNNWGNDLPPVVEEQTRVLGYCRSNRHGRAKRVVVWGPDGLLALCKMCGREVLFTWSQIEDIKHTFERKQEQAS